MNLLKQLVRITVGRETADVERCSAMKLFGRVVGWLVIATILGLMLRYRIQLKGFEVLTTRDAGVDAILIRDKQRLPVYAEFVDHNTEGRGECKSYQFFFRGKEAMLITLNSNGQVCASTVTYYTENGKPRAAWIDRRGDGTFTDHEVHENGKTRKEILVGDTWMVPEKRDGVGGVVVDGQWFPVKFTNGVWQIQRDHMQGDR